MREQLPFAGKYWRTGWFLVQNDDGRGSGGGLCWRATRQGILCRKLIPMSHRRAGLRSPVQTGPCHRDRFPDALENSTPLAATKAAAQRSSQTLPANNSPAPNAAALDYKTAQ